LKKEENIVTGDTNTHMGELSKVMTPQYIEYIVAHHKKQSE
jgi:hypothetical protein